MSFGLVHFRQLLIDWTNCLTFFFSKNIKRGLNLQEVALRFHLTEHFREKVPLALSVLKTVVAQPDFNNFEENGCHILSIPSASVIC